MKKEDKKGKAIKVIKDEGTKTNADTETKKSEAIKKEKAPKPDRITKKSTIIEILNRPKGGTIDEMAQLCTDRGLGDFDRNKKTAALWLSKIGFKVVKDDKGAYKKA